MCMCANAHLLDWAWGLSPDQNQQHAPPIMEQTCILCPSPRSFLESLVKRLSAELARRQAALGESGASTETELLVDDGSPMPGWLKDRRYLNPLLAAYDDKIAGLEAEAGARTEQIARLQRQVRRGRGMFQGSEVITRSGDEALLAGVAFMQALVAGTSA